MANEGKILVQFHKFFSFLKDTNPVLPKAEDARTRLAGLN